jgi:uncharacterized protein (DUF362 family)
MDNKIFVLYSQNIFYPKVSPFHPSEEYPEYPFGKINISSEINNIYKEVRLLFNSMGLDSENFGKPIWNPFKDFIKPGDNVLIKPNMVNHFHPLGFSMDCLITNGSMIRVVIDYAFIALGGKGKITIGDAPIQSAVFESIVEINGINKIIEFYKREASSVQLECLDFRQTVAITNSKGRLLMTKQQEICEFKILNLKETSFFSNVNNRRFAVADYSYSVMNDYHSDGNHKYLVPQTLLDADVIINLPKPKTHRFAGLTGAMKNFIGINSQKENLPHHSLGSKTENGDEYPSKSYMKKFVAYLTNQITILATQNRYQLSLPLYLLRFLAIRMVKHDNQIYKGSWYGNDTIWRTILDVNRIVIYADKKGNISKTRQRTVFTICDSIVAGEKQGPLEPTPKTTDTIIAGFNLYTIDRFLSEFMGFNSLYLPFIQHCPPDLGKIPDSDLEIIQCHEEGNSIKFNDFKTNFNFIPSNGWEVITETK